MVKVDNPTTTPTRPSIAEAQEPYAKVSIISPPDYVGNIMPMCQERRGVFKDMQYLDTNLVELHYSMPLNEIIYDFFDTLKARTKGYASLDYELEGYRAQRPGEGGSAAQRRPGGRPVLHRPPGQGLSRARRLCEKPEGQHPPPAL